MLAFIGNFYQKAAVCLSPCTFGFINRNNAAGNIVGNDYEIFGIFSVLKKVIRRFDSVLNAPETEALYMRDAPLAEIYVSVLITDEYIAVIKTERAWREANGRLLIRLSKESEHVTRVFCGLSQRLK